MGEEGDKIRNTRKRLGGVGCEEGYSKTALHGTTGVTSASVRLTFGSHLDETHLKEHRTQ